ISTRRIDYSCPAIRECWSRRKAKSWTSSRGSTWCSIGIGRKRGSNRDSFSSLIDSYRLTLLGDPPLDAFSGRKVPEWDQSHHDRAAGEHPPLAFQHVGNEE